MFTLENIPSKLSNETFCEFSNYLLTSGKHRETYEKWLREEKLAHARQTGIDDVLKQLEADLNEAKVTLQQEKQPKASPEYILQQIKQLENVLDQRGRERFVRKIKVDYYTLDEQIHEDYQIFKKKIPEQRTIVLRQYN